MSCSNPLTLRNGSNYFNPLFDRFLLQVPCGKCDGCVLQMRDDWAIRSSFQVDYFKKIGGNTIFVTLTYSNKNLPNFNQLEITKDIDQPCFNYNHIRTYVESLRKKFLRANGELARNISYLCVSEFGAKTKRPHYHVLFHLPAGIDPLGFYDECVNLWSYGFVFPDMYYRDSNGKALFKIGRETLLNNLLVKSENCCCYVSKYVSKDMSFYNLPLVELAIQRAITHDENGKKIFNQDIKHRLPRHFQSKGYGVYMLDYILNQADPFKVLLDGYKFPLSINKVYSIPRYIVDKLCFHRCADHREKTDFCVQFDVHKLKRTIEENTKRFSDMFSTVYLRNCIGCDDTTVISSNYSEYGFDKVDISSVPKVLKYLDSLLAGRSFHTLAVYNSFYRNRYLRSYSHDYCEDPLEFAFDNLYNSQFRSYDTKYKISQHTLDTNFTNACNADYAFHDFDTILDILKDFSSFKSKQTNRARESRLQQTLDTRQINKPIPIY